MRTPSRGAYARGTSSWISARSRSAGGSGARGLPARVRLRSALSPAAPPPPTARMSGSISAARGEGGEVGVPRPVGSMVRRLWAAERSVRDRSSDMRGCRNLPPTRLSAAAPRDSDQPTRTRTTARRGVTELPPGAVCTAAVIQRRCAAGGGREGGGAGGPEVVAVEGEALEGREVADARRQRRQRVAVQRQAPQRTQPPCPVPSSHTPTKTEGGTADSDEAATRNRTGRLGVAVTRTRRLGARRLGWPVGPGAPGSGGRAVCEGGGTEGGGEGGEAVVVEPERRQVGQAPHRLRQLLQLVAAQHQRLPPPPQHIEVSPPTHTPPLPEAPAPPDLTATSESPVSGVIAGCRPAGPSESARRTHRWSIQICCFAQDSIQDPWV